MRIFNHVKFNALDFDLVAETTESGRLYTVPGGFKYPSVTTILSTMKKDALQNWINWIGEEEAEKICNLAASRGSKLHLACEEYLSNKLSPMKIKGLMPDTKALFIPLKPVLDNSIGNVYCFEQALFSHKLKTAGRVDLVADWDNEIAIIDFKSSTKVKDEKNIRHYFMQCSVYAEMLEEIVGEKINKIVVAISSEHGKIPQIFVRDKRNYITETVDFINNYHRTRI
jgi:hypothetical protein